MEPSPRCEIKRNENEKVSMLLFIFFSKKKKKRIENIYIYAFTCTDYLCNIVLQRQSNKGARNRVNTFFRD